MNKFPFYLTERRNTETFFTRKMANDFPKKKNSDLKINERDAVKLSKKIKTSFLVAFLVALSFG